MMKSRLSPHACLYRCLLAMILASLVKVLFCPSAICATLENPPGSVNLPLIQTNALAAQAGFQISSGNGNHAIDPNECNSLTLVLTNISGQPISGIHASLITTDPDVIITQPQASYPDLAVNSTVTNDVPFQISTLQSFTGGRTIHGSLIIASTSSGLFSVPVTLITGEIAPTGMRTDNNSVLNIPTTSTVESTNIVSGFTNILGKVVVSLYVTDPSDQTLTNLSLISPDGTTILLSSANGGTGQNYGSGTADANRSVFDDSATSAITQGTAPFVGNFRPQMPLSTFHGSTNVNGAWRLHLANGSATTSAALQAWSLFLYPVTNTDGGGACELCPLNTFLTNYLSDSSSRLPQRLFRDSISSLCSSPKAYPGFITNYNGGFPYQAYPFYNGPSNTCVNVTVTAPQEDIVSAAFAVTFDPNNLQTTYLADSGNSTEGTTAISYSFDIQPDSIFIIVVNDVFEENISGLTTNRSYTLSVSGGDCEPRLNIANAGTNQVDVKWPTVPGNFKLITSAQITPILWSTVTNEPVAIQGRLNITNRSDLTPQRIYRLQGY